MVLLPMALPYTQALLDAAGNVSPVNLIVDSALTSTTSTISFDSATTFGEDQALLDRGRGMGTMAANRRCGSGMRSIHEARG